MGRLVRDPESRQAGETTVAKFTLAVDRMKKGETDFINCTAFGKSAEFVEKYLSKGTKIAIEGRWQTGTYTNKEGQKVYTNDCIIDRMEFAESKRADTAPTPSRDGVDDFMSGDIDDEMPFGDLPV